MQNIGEWLASIDKTVLTPLVRETLRNERVEIIDWEYRPLGGGASDGGAGLQGLYRSAGRARDQAEIVSWSLILKFFSSPAHGGDPQGGMREWQAYESGVLQNLPGGIAAVRCFGLVEMPEQELHLIWLEDITDAYGKWPLQRYALAARHLGQLNGAYLASNSLPDWAWMSRGWLRHTFLPQAAPAMQQFASVLDHPLVRRVYPPEVAAVLLRIWEERDLFLNKLDRLPQTFCHMDAFRRNLFARRAADGQDQTVAIDWAFSGVGALGEELVPLIQASIAFREADVADLPALEDLAFDGYLEGLREAGWHGDPQLVHCGYAVAALLRYGVGAIGLGLPALLDESQHGFLEQIFRLPINELTDFWSEGLRHVVKMSIKARALMDKIP